MATYQNNRRNPNDKVRVVVWTFLISLLVTTTLYHWIFG